MPAWAVGIQNTVNGLQNTVNGLQNTVNGLQNTFVQGLQEMRTALRNSEIRTLNRMQPAWRALMIQNAGGGAAIGSVPGSTTIGGIFPDSSDTLMQFQNAQIAALTNYDIRHDEHRVSAMAVIIFKRREARCLIGSCMGNCVKKYSPFCQAQIKVVCSKTHML